MKPQDDRVEPIDPTLMEKTIPPVREAEGGRQRKSRLRDPFVLTFLAASCVVYLGVGAVFTGRIDRNFLISIGWLAQAGTVPSYAPARPSSIIPVSNTGPSIAPSRPPQVERQPSAIDSPKSSDRVLPDVVQSPRPAQFVVAEANSPVYASSGAAASSSRVALVIGNSAYRNEPVLRNPLNDAQDVSESLKRLGFKVQTVNNASYDQMRRALGEFSSKARDADIAGVFFAGHGMEVAGKNYLLPVDATIQSDQDVANEAFVLDNVMNMASSAKTLGFIILDACRTNPLAIKMQRSNLSRDSTRGLARVEPNRGKSLLVAYAAREGTTAADGNGRNSPFTAALLKNLETPSEIRLVFAGIRDDVMAATNGIQEPVIYGSLSRQEIFLKPRAAATPAVSPSPPPINEAEIHWSAIKNAKDIVLFEEFIQKFPNHAMSKSAQQRIDQLKRDGAPQATAMLLPQPSPPPKQDPSVDRVTPKPPLALRAVLYDEEPSSPNGKQHVGSVVWRADPVKVGGQTFMAARGDIDIPGRPLKLTLLARVNTDVSLPASHTVEITFALPKDFDGGRVNNIPGILVKSTEQARGKPLAGLAVKVTENFFLVGLSNVDDDRKKNLGLVRDGAWLDIPVVYGNQRRGIIAVEMGLPDDNLFAKEIARTSSDAKSIDVALAKPADPSGSSSGYVVQVASQRSESDARAAFEGLRARFPKSLGSRSCVVKRADLGDKGVFYRCILGPFETAETAVQMCSDLKNEGGQCVVQRN